MPDLPTTYPKAQNVDRVYRAFSAPDLLKFRVAIGESDLWVMTDHDLRGQIVSILKNHRRQLKEYIVQNPLFATTLVPYPMDDTAPEIVQRMILATAKAGVGPMAAVAGSFAELIGKSLSGCELIIENGGDIYLRSNKERIIAIYAGKSIFSNKIGIVIPPQPDGVGICTSAGTVGPSFSFGKADAAVIIAPSSSLADAMATAVGNLIQTAADLPKSIAWIQNIPEVGGCILIKDDKIAVWGKYQLIPITTKVS